ncbi:MAG: IclR family transcriptional regulator [Bacillota bacterium]
MGRNRKEESGVTVRSVNRALSLLELMAEENNPIALSELAEKAGLKMSTVHRLLTTMMRKGFVEQDAVSLRYRLGVKTLEIGSAALLVNNLRILIRPYLKQIAERINETVNLAVLDGTEVVYIDQIESTNIVIVKMFARIGSRGPAYCTGTGKALLAGLTVEELRKRLAGIDFKKFTEYTLTNAEQLTAKLVQIKKDGYALDFSERDIGVTCVAVPVKDPDGRVQAAISVSGPEQRMARERIDREILPYLLQISAEITPKFAKRP